MSTSDFIGKDIRRESVDLTNCDREPIHIPGAIQPHGVLLVLTEPALSIIQVSSNTQNIFGIAPHEILNKPLESLIERAQVDFIRNNLSLEHFGSINPLKITVKTADQESLFDGVLHRVDDVLVLEMEPTTVKEHTPFPGFYHSVRTSSTLLQGVANLNSLCQAAADEVQKMTGFDRVMIYRFDKDWNGEVIAESRREDLDPYLGLHYPASDIPRQARELYRHNWLRLIANVAYQPAVLIPTNNPVTGRPLDLSSSVLRSVSPIHIEYLKNMRVGASMSVSIIKNGQLWGLISCHHTVPKYIPYEVRIACEFLGQILSLQVAAREDFEDYAYEMKIKDVLAQLLNHMLQHESALDALMSSGEHVLNVVGAQGAAFYFDNQYHVVGTVPNEADGRRILEWVKQQEKDDIVYTHSLPMLYPEAEQCKDVASGLLAISISPLQGSYVLWFRPEVIQIVQWGGDPRKPVEIQDDTPRLHPRKSFEIWGQTVRLTALPWKQSEIDAARAVRSAVIDRVLRETLLHRTQELARLNEELLQSNQELDSFAYIASHDLKEPVRGIQNYAAILKEDYANTLDNAGKDKLNTLIRLAQRIDDLISSLLHYSRVGRVELAFADTNLQEIVQRVLEILSVGIKEEGVQIRIPRPLPTIWCDRVRVGEVFNNLITNAIKYNDKQDRWIEIGYIEPDKQTEGDKYTHPIVFYIRDNGIGIREKYYDVIFRIFKRLHGRDKFGGGTGSGLTIVKRIIDRHGGKIWLESSQGVGTTFFFTLQKD